MPTWRSALTRSSRSRNSSSSSTNRSSTTHRACTCVSGLRLPSRLNRTSSSSTRSLPSGMLPSVRNALRHLRRRRRRDARSCSSRMTRARSAASATTRSGLNGARCRRLDPPLMCCGRTSQRQRRTAPVLFRRGLLPIRTRLRADQSRLPASTSSKKGRARRRHSERHGRSARRAMRGGCDCGTRSANRFLGCRSVWRCIVTVGRTFSGPERVGQDMTSRWAMAQSS